MWLGLVLSAVASVGRAADQQPVMLDPGQRSVPLAGHIAVLRDAQGAWNLEDVTSAPLRDRFAAAPGARFNNRFSQDAFWYRFKLRDGRTEGDPARWILNIGLPLLDYVDVHVSRGNDQVQTTLTGDLRQPPPEQLSHREFAIPIEVGVGEELTVHVRVRQQGRSQVHLSITTAESFRDIFLPHYVWAGAYYGIILAMVLYNLLVGIWARDRIYIYFAACLLGFGVLGFLISGYARNFGNSITPFAPQWINAGTILLPLAGTAGWVLFSRVLLDTRAQAPRIHRLLGALLVLCLLAVVLCPLVGLRTTVQVGLILLAAVAGTLFAGSVYLAIKGMRAARIYLIAWGAMIGGMVFFVVQALGASEPSYYASYASPVTTVLSAILFSIVLADRVNTERLGRERFALLKQYLPQRVADMVVDGNTALLEPKRRNVTVCMIDLRGFTPFAETAAPEEVMAVLREFYETMGAIIDRHGGTVEHFAGDSMLIFFNAPLESPGPENQAVQTALEMRAAFETLRNRWQKLGHELGLGIGIAHGYATIGAIGFASRSQYAAIGAVTNLASRLCDIARHGEILTTSRVLAAVDSNIDAQSAGEQMIRGFTKPVQIVRVLGLKPGLPGAEVSMATA